MSSTIDVGRERTRGQVLAIFAFGLIGIIAVAALVFDVGQNLFERRMQQDASDAAALAGARYLVEPACKAAPSLASCPQAEAAAREITTLHGYATAQVTVKIPPDNTTRFAGFPGHIQVGIANTRASYFAGVLGMTSFRVASMAVAANIDDYSFPFSFLALDPSTCKAGHAHGNGTLHVEGDVMVLSDCTSPGALVFDGNRTVVDVAGNCGTVGTIDIGPSATAVCGSYSEGAPPISDPLAGLDGPSPGGTAVPDPPNVPLLVSGGDLTNKVDDCPGMPAGATAASPKLCVIQPKTSPSVVRIYPGVYYGGINLSEPNAARQLTVYMEPGLYVMAGGGFLVDGGVNLITVDPGGTSYATASGGVMIYNTDGPTCGTSGNCIRPIDFRNTAGGDIRMRGYQGLVYTNLLFFQDRDASSQPPLKITGNATSTYSGTIYIPNALFSYEGNGTGNVLDAQVICDEFDVGGNGNVTVTYDPDTALQLSGAGLVQ